MIKVEINKVLDALGKDIVLQAKKNMQSSKISTAGHLYKGMSSASKINKNSVEATITIANYWEYMNYGVSGVGGEKADGTNWVKKRVTNNKYKYRDKTPPPSVFSKITSDRGGQFAIAKSVFHTGLKTTLFFSNPFEKEMKELNAKIEKAVAKGVEDSLDKTTI